MIAPCIDDLGKRAEKGGGGESEALRKGLLSFIEKPILESYPEEGIMKRVFCFLVGISFLVSCGAKQPKIDKVIEDGVEVVLNHLEPYVLKGQPSRLVINEETRIDFEKAEYSGLGLKEPDYADADSQGNIYVVEQYSDSEFFIYKFSSTGGFIKRLGKKGQGPGELQGISSLVVNENDHILISDRSAGKVVEFDAEGNLINETKVRYVVQEVVPLENGNYIGRRTAKDSSESRKWFVCLFNADFEEVKKLDSFDMSAYVPGKPTPGTIISFYWRVANGKIYIGNEQRGYELWVYDLEGNLLRKIRKEYKPVPYPEEFKKQTEALAARQPAMNLVPRQDTPPFNSFFSDDEGRLYVMTYEQGTNQDEYIHDVFSKDGVLVARVSLGKYGIMGRALNHLRATATNGNFYRVAFKENGYPELIVYRMAWN